MYSGGNGVGEVLHSSILMDSEVVGCTSTYSEVPDIDGGQAELLRYTMKAELQTRVQWLCCVCCTG